MKASRSVWLAPAARAERRGSSRRRQNGEGRVKARRRTGTISDDRPLLRFVFVGGGPPLLAVG